MRDIRDLSGTVCLQTHPQPAPDLLSVHSSLSFFNVGPYTLKGVAEPFNLHPGPILLVTLDIVGGAQCYLGDKRAGVVHGVAVKPHPYRVGGLHRHKAPTLFETPGHFGHFGHLVWVSLYARYCIEIKPESTPPEVTATTFLCVTDPKHGHFADTSATL